MLEAGIGRAHNIALATPAELRAARRRLRQQALLEADIIQPAVETTPQGTIALRDEPGFGYALDLDFIRSITVREELSSIGLTSGDESVPVAAARTTATTAIRGSARWSARSATTSTTSRSSAWCWRNTHSGLVVTRRHAGARHSRRSWPGPLAGVLLDRFDRKRIMIASDLVRAVVALCFILTVNRTETWLLYLLSGLLMVASPFFTSGRAAILPSIATREELHTANSLTQTTQWTTLSIGAFLGGASVTQFGFKLGLRRQLALLSDLRLLHLAPVPAGPRLPAAARRALPKPKSCAPGTNTSKDCATCAPVR